MATKKEVDDLKSKISILGDQLQRRDEEITRLSIHNNNLVQEIERLHDLNGFLSEERDRLGRSDQLNKQICIDLMNAIAVLGRKEANRISNEVWHSCQSGQLQAMSITDTTNKKDMDNYFDANS